jgi:hypothetical protein
MLQDLAMFYSLKSHTILQVYLIDKYCCVVRISSREVSCDGSWGKDIPGATWW